ncbi:tetratricopeptide repeat protein, partial [Myxococcota bacterium]|nr:tetratricopeptide repeat protein [Myxococcota bacterium]
MHIIIFLALTLSASPPSDKRARSRVAQSRGQIAFRSGDLKKALEHFSRATTLDSAYGEPWYWLGVTCERLGRLKQAEKALLTAVELGEPQVALLKLLGSIQVRLKKFSWAMRTLSGARELSPKDHEVAVLLAYCLVFTEEYDDAAKLLREVLARGSRATKERARVLLGILHYRMKKLARARMVLSRGEEFSSLKSRILSLIVKKELGIKRGIGGTLSFSLGFDSNPALNADPDRSLITTGDGGLVSTLSAYMWMHPTDALATELSVVRTFYAAPWDQKTHDRIASFNMTLLEAGAFYRYRYLSDRGQHRRLEAGYIFSLTALDGGEGIPSEPDPFLFSEKHSLLLSYHRAPH